MGVCNWSPQNRWHILKLCNWPRLWVCNLGFSADNRAFLRCEAFPKYGHVLVFGIGNSFLPRSYCIVFLHTRLAARNKRWLALAEWSGESSLGMRRNPRQKQVSIVGRRSRQWRGDFRGIVVEALLGLAIGFVPLSCPPLLLPCTHKHVTSRLSCLLFHSALRGMHTV